MAKRTDAQAAVNKLRTAQTAAEARFAKADGEKKQAAEASRLKKVQEAKDRDHADAKEDEIRFTKIKTKVQAEITKLQAAIAAGDSSKQALLTKKQALLTQADKMITGAKTFF